jgi:Uma2 family endonuclease
MVVSGKRFVMAVPVLTPVSPQEYLELERASLLRNEYFEGEITALAGASLAHGRILINLVRQVGNMLAGKPCEILPNDMRVGTPSRTSYMYPDATIVCGGPDMEDDRFDTLKNPVVIFEILSPSTRKHYRVKKFHFYRQIPSFREYILIDSTEHFVEIGRRQPDGSWKFEVEADVSGHLFISSIHCSVPLAELYRNIF